MYTNIVNFYIYRISQRQKSKERTWQTETKTAENKRLLLFVHVCVCVREWSLCFLFCPHWKKIVFALGFIYTIWFAWHHHFGLNGQWNTSNNNRSSLFYLSVSSVTKRFTAHDQGKVSFLYILPDLIWTGVVMVFGEFFLRKKNRLKLCRWSYVISYEIGYERL